MTQSLGAVSTGGAASIDPMKALRADRRVETLASTRLCYLGTVLVMG
jgi:hypothetical protein